MIGFAISLYQVVLGSVTPVGPVNAELREDGSYELREDGTYELRE